MINFIIGLIMTIVFSMSTMCVDNPYLRLTIVLCVAGMGVVGGYELGIWRGGQK